MGKGGYNPPKMPINSSLFYEVWRQFDWRKVMTILMVLGQARRSKKIRDWLSVRELTILVGNIMSLHLEAGEMYRKLDDMERLGLIEKRAVEFRGVKGGGRLYRATDLGIMIEPYVTAFFMIIKDKLLTIEKGEKTDADKVNEMIAEIISKRGEEYV